MSRKYKPEYTIINDDDGGFSLYRKLDTGEEIWYVNELHRLKSENESIWLHLQSNQDNVILERIKNQLNKVSTSTAD